jgi:hypothetical protein
LVQQHCPELPPPGASDRVRILNRSASLQSSNCDRSRLDLVLAHYACAVNACICLRGRTDARGGNTFEAYARSAHVRRIGGNSDPASWDSATGAGVGFHEDHRAIGARSGTRDSAGGMRPDYGPRCCRGTGWQFDLWRLAHDTGRTTTSWLHGRDMRTLVFGGISWGRKWPCDPSMSTWAARGRRGRLCGLRGHTRNYRRPGGDEGREHMSGCPGTRGSHTPLHGSPPRISTNETDEPVHSVGQSMMSPLQFLSSAYTRQSCRPASPLPR